MDFFGILLQMVTSNFVTMELLIKEPPPCKGGLLQSRANTSFGIVLPLNEGGPSIKDTCFGFVFFGLSTEDNSTGLFWSFPWGFNCIFYRLWAVFTLACSMHQFSQLLLLLAEILRVVVEGCVVGAAVVDLCEKGDTLILEETSKVYKREKEMKKGEQGYKVDEGV